MAKVLAFPGHGRTDCGTVHVMSSEGGGFDVSHESRSGNSWGGLEFFASAQDAIADAYRQARDVYGGCDVFICPAAIAALEPSSPKGDF